jgi:hypothetical protein
MGGMGRAVLSSQGDEVPEKIRRRLRELEESLRRTAVGIYRHQCTPKDIIMGSMNALVIEAQISELEWVLSQIE